jgi:hypothetical protein
MSEITGIARLKIHPGKLQEFKDLQAQKALEGSPVRIYTPHQSL